MPKTRTATTVMKIIITIARFSNKGVGTLSLSGPNPGPGDSVVVESVGGFVGGMFSEVVDGIDCVDVLDEVASGVLNFVVVVVVVVVVLVVVIVVDLKIEIVVVGSVTI